MPFPGTYTTLPQKPAYSATLSVNWSLGDIFEPGAATANFTPTFVPGYVGQICTFVFLQDGTGGRTITWPASVIGSPPAATTTANAKTIYRFRYDGTNWLYGG